MYVALVGAEMFRESEEERARSATDVAVIFRVGIVEVLADFRGELPPDGRLMLLALDTAAAGDGNVGVRKSLVSRVVAAGVWGPDDAARGDLAPPRSLPLSLSLRSLSLSLSQPRSVSLSLSLSRASRSL